FDSLEDTEAAVEAGIEPIDLRVLLLDLFQAQSTGVMCRLGMIGHAKIFIAASAHLPRHLFERMHPVGRHRVSVQDAAKVALRSPAAGCGVAAPTRFRCVPRAIPVPRIEAATGRRWRPRFPTPRGRRFCARPHRSTPIVPTWRSERVAADALATRWPRA